MNLKELKLSSKNNLKSNYLKYFLISTIAFLTGIEIKIVLSEYPNYLNIIQISYLMVLLNLIVRPVYVFYLKNVYLSADFKKTGIKREYIGKITAVYFIKKVISFTGFLLFIVPGIYFAIQFLFVPYVLSENPDMSISDVFNTGRKLVKGKTVLILKLFLNYFKWYILGFLCLGIGMLFVNPFFEMAKKELYIYIKKEM